MKTVSIIIICLVIFVYPHTGPLEAQQNRIKIVATMEIFASIAEDIGGYLVETDYILPEGMDPHSYSLTYDDIRKAQEADLLIFANTQFFTLEQKLLDNIENKLYVDFSDYEKYNLSLIGIPGLEVNYHGYWIYPDNALAIAKAVHEKLVLLDPDNKDIYDHNLEVFEEKILRIKSLLIKTAIAHELYGAGAVIAVPGAAYVAFSFGLRVKASLLIEPGKFINASELERIRNLAENGKIKVILCPEELKDAKPGEYSRQLSEEFKIPIAYVRVFSLGGIQDYFALMTYNAGVISSLSESISGGISKEILYWFYVALAILFAIVFLESTMIFLYKRRAEVEWSE